MNGHFTDYSCNFTPSLLSLCHNRIRKTNSYMKKSILLLLILFTVSGADARNLWAYLTFSTFNSPEGPYVETYLSIAANSVKFVKKENGKFQASVNIIMTFKKDGQIKAFKKYDFFSSEIEDTTKVNFSDIDQQRFAIPNGTYEFEIKLADNNKSVPAIPYTQQVTVDFPDNKPSFSGIQFVQSYSKTDVPGDLTKSGYDLRPHVYSFYPPTESKLIFYAEVYNADKIFPKEQKYLISYGIEAYENGMRLPEYTRMRKENPREVSVLLAELNLENLATGTYNLFVEIRNQQNEAIATQRTVFQRSNPSAQMPVTDLQTAEIKNTFVEKYTNIDTLREYINSTYPIAGGLEKSFIRGSVKKSDLKTLQQFFFTFWQQRDPMNPEKRWLAYKLEVEKAQANFGTPVKKGFQTDRGRVFLQYGPPNTREGHYNEPSSYPYEIWQYYTLNQTQRNKKFVFYSQDMVTSDFTLLHSDAIGEVTEPRWQIFLRSRIYAPLDLQDTQIINAWGEQDASSWTLPTSNL